MILLRVVLFDSTQRSLDPRVGTALLCYLIKKNKGGSNVGEVKTYN